MSEIRRRSAEHAAPLSPQRRRHMTAPCSRERNAIGSASPVLTVEELLHSGQNAEVHLHLRQDRAKRFDRLSMRGSFGNHGPLSRDRPFGLIDRFDDDRVLGGIGHDLTHAVCIDRQMLPARSYRKTTTVSLGSETYPQGQSREVSSSRDLDVPGLKAAFSYFIDVLG
jgi:hypothetical protein